MTKLTIIADLIICICAATAANAITIAANGAAKATIVLSANATIQETHAAGELATFLQQVTGTTFQTAEKPIAGRANVCVGVGAAKAVDPGFSTKGLGEDGLVVRTVGDDLILAGGDPRGTLYAVYTFLEDYVGCRWWTAKESFIPKKPSLAFPSISRRYVPHFEHRDIVPINTSSKDPDWSVRNKCVGELHGLRSLAVMPERGGCRKAHPSGHSYFYILPPDKYFGDHPEWYSLIDGKRVASPSIHANLCLTNEEMKKQWTRNFLAEVRKAPTYYPPQYVNRVPNPIMFAGVSAEDDSGYPCRCQCEYCLAVEKEEESPAGLNLRFANEMARALKAEMPEKTVVFYAYHFTMKPPKITRPDPNVLVYFCPIHVSSNARPMTDARYKQWDEDLRGWLKISPKVYIYDYPVNLVYEFTPHPNLRGLAANIKHWAKLGVKGYYGDGFGDVDSPIAVHGGNEMAELRAWLAAKLLWDPSLDPNKIIREFCNGYYGAAGKHIIDYLDVMHDAAEASGDAVSLSSPPDAAFLSIQTLTSGWAHLKAAEEAVEARPDLLRKVRIAQLPSLFVLLARWETLKDDSICRGIKWPLPESREEVLRKFNDIVEENDLVLGRETTTWLAKGGK